MWGKTGCLGHLDLRSRSVLSAERSEVTGECRELWPRQGGSRDTSRMQPALPAGTVTALSPDVPWSGPAAPSPVSTVNLGPGKVRTSGRRAET